MEERKSRSRIRRQTILFAILFFPSAASATPLSEILTKTRRNAPEVKQAVSEVTVAKSDVDAPTGAYDPQLNAEAQVYRDRAEQTSAFAGDERQGVKQSLTLSQLFSTGTLLSAKLSHARDKTIFPAPTAGAGFDPSTSTSYNPAARTEVTFSVAQPLWRNWLAREIKIQQQIASAAVQESEARQNLQSQLVQSEAENLYWQYALLHAQIGTTKRLLERSKKFRQLMRQRRQLGRADDVDLAAAESSVISQEGRLLQLEVAVDDVLQSLAYRVDPSGQSRLGLRKNPPKLDTKGEEPVASAESLYEQAVKRRFDLAQLKAAKGPVQHQRDLAQHQQRPDINLFASVGTTGLKESSADSLDDTFDDGDHLTTSLGLSLNMTLGQTALRAKERRAITQIAAIDTRMEVVKRDLRREAALIVQALRSSQKLLAQSDRQIRSLQSKRRAEMRKFRQARSEEIAAVSYDMEILSAELDRLQTLKSQRDAWTRQRLLTHAYAIDGPGQGRDP